MNKWQLMVREFHEKSECTINKKPKQISEADCMLRLKLIAEELDELAKAMGFRMFSGSAPQTKPLKLFNASYNLVEIADALGDLLYVVLGTAVTCGIDIEPIFEEIHRSNMTKFIDGYRREDGKWIKGPSYTPVNLKPIIDAQA